MAATKEPKSKGDIDSSSDEEGTSEELSDDSDDDDAAAQASKTKKGPGKKDTGATKAVVPPKTAKNI